MRNIIIFLYMNTNQVVDARYKTVGHDNRWGHQTKCRKMRNHNNEDHKFASFLIIAYIYRLIFWDNLTYLTRLNLK
jgi:hypothetical protein